MGHTRKHKSEHIEGGLDSISRDKLTGIKDNILRQLPARTDYVEYLKTKVLNTQVFGDNTINQIIEDGTFIYISTGWRILKCNKSDLEIVNYYEAPNRPQSTPSAMCITTNYLYFSTAGVRQSIIKLNKSDLSLVSFLQVGYNLLTVTTDGTFVYTTDYAGSGHINKYDLDLTLLDTLTPTYNNAWVAKYSAGYLYIEQEEIGLTIEKIDVATFTSVGVGDFSANWSYSYSMTIMGSNLFLTAIDTSWNSAILKISTALVEIGNTTPTSNPLEGICNDGTNVYYTDAGDLDVKKIDVDLSAVEEALTGFTAGSIGIDADASNLFIGTEYLNPSKWGKFTKTGIAEVLEKTGTTTITLNSDNSFCSDSEFIFYITDYQQRLRKLNIDTFEIISAAADLPDADVITYSPILVCDESKIYIVGYVSYTSPISKLLVYDINTLVLLENIDLSIATYKYVSKITVDKNYIYIGGSKSGEGGKVSKLNKQTYALISQFTLSNDWRTIKDLVIAKDYLYVIHQFSPNSRVIQINTATMTEITYTTIPETTTEFVSAYDGRYLFCAGASSNNIFRVDTVDMSLLTINTGAPIVGLGIGNYLYVGRKSGNPPTQVASIDVFNPVTGVELIERRITLTDAVTNLQWLSIMNRTRHLFVKGFLFLNIDSDMIRVYVGDEDKTYPQGPTGPTGATGPQGVNTGAPGDFDIVGEISIKVYSQTTEPTLGQDNRIAIWIDTDDSNRVYLVFRRGTGDQVAVELG